jgi:hypothetical protein
MQSATKIIPYAFACSHGNCDIFCYTSSNQPPYIDRYSDTNANTNDDPAGSGNDRQRPHHVSLSW